MTLNSIVTWIIVGGIAGLLAVLNTAATTRVALSYDGIVPSAPSDPTTDPVTNVTIGGVLCDLVYYPDYYPNPTTSPSLVPQGEILCRYPTTASPTNSSRLRAEHGFRSPGLELSDTHRSDGFRRSHV